MNSPVASTEPLLYIDQFPQEVSSFVFKGDVLYTEMCTQFLSSSKFDSIVIFSANPDSHSRLISSYKISLDESCLENLCVQLDPLFNPKTQIRKILPDIKILLDSKKPDEYYLITKFSPSILILRHSKLSKGMIIIPRFDVFVVGFYKHISTTLASATLSQFCKKHFHSSVFKPGTLNQPQKVFGKA